MTGLLQLVDRLRRANVRLRADGGTLSYSALDGDLGADLRQEIEEHRAALLGLVRRNERPAGSGAEPSAAPRPSLAQRRLWLLAQQSVRPAVFNLPVALRLDGPLDPQALLSAVRCLAASYPILTTRFREVAGDLDVSWVGQDGPACDFLDISAVAATERASTLQSLVAESCVAPFDPAAGRLLRCRVVRVGETEHAVVIVASHLVADARSMQIFARQLEAAYAAIRAGRSWAPGPQAPCFWDFVAWQEREVARFAERQPQATRDLSGRLPVLRLAADHRRPSIPTMRGGVADLACQPALVQALRQVARQRGCSLFVLLLAAFKLLLLRHSGQQDLVVGCPTLGRPVQHLREVVGPCANIVVLRSQVDPNEPFAVLLSRLRDAVANALANEVPFEMVVQALRPERSANVSPIFQAMFNLEGGDGTQAALQLGTCRSSLLPVATEVSHFDWHMTLFESPDRVTGSLLYNADLFDAATMRSVATEYGDLLGRLPGAHGQTIRQLLLPRVSVKTRVVLAGNFFAEPIGRTVQAWMDHLALPVTVLALPPDQPMQALLDGSGAPAAGESGLLLLALEPTTLEAWLAGPAPGSTSRLQALLQAVQARAARSDVAVTLLPCANRAPAAASPVDVVSKALAAMLGDGLLDLSRAADAWQLDGPLRGEQSRPGEVAFGDDAGVLIATALARQIGRRFLPAVKVIVLDCDHTLWDGACGDTPPELIRVSPGHAALQAFMVRQTQLGRLVCLCSRNTERDVLAVFARGPAMPLGLQHVAARRVNHAPKPANLVALAAELNLGLDSFLFLDDDPLECAQVRQSCPAIQVRQVPRDPAGIETWLQALPLGTDRPATGEGRRRTRLYQEHAQRKDAERVGESVGDLLERIEFRADLRALGPGGAEAEMRRIAELTQRTNQFNLEKRPLRPSQLREQLASPGWQAWTVSATDRFGDYGLAGALVAGIAGDAAVVEQLVLSCRAFNRGLEFRLAAALLDWAEARGLRSVQYRFVPTSANGPARAFLRALGLEPEGGEAAKLRLPTGAAGRAAVASAERAALSRPLATAPVHGEPAEAEAGEARRVWLDRLAPLLDVPADARVIRAALGIRVAPRPIDPSLPLLQRLTAAAADILALPALEPDANLFALGADSLLLLRLAARCRAQGLDIGLDDFLEHQTVRELAAALSARTATPRPALSGEPFALLCPADWQRLAGQPGIADAYPLSGMQAGMVFHAAQDPDAAIYQVIDSFRLRGAFDPAAFEAALARVVLRHETLRTRFDLVSWSEPLAIVSTAASAEVAVRDLRHLPPGDRGRVFADWLGCERRAVFKAESALVRFTVHWLENDLFEVTITHHHAILDGWSLNSLVRELLHAYAATLAGRPLPALAAPQPGYGAFIRAEREAVAATASRAFWATTLDGVVVSRPNRIVPDTAPQPHVQQVTIPVQVGAALAGLVAHAALPLKSLLLAVHLAVIAAWTGSREVTTGVLMNGRLEAGQGDEVLGLFVNSVPLRARLGAGSWLSLARQAFALEKSIEPHRRVPLPELQRLAGVAPLFEFLFTFTHFHVLGGLREDSPLEVVETYNFVRDSVPVHAFVDVNPYHAQELRLLLNVDAARVTPAERESLAALYAAALQGMAATPDASWLGCLPSLAAAGATTPEPPLPAADVNACFHHHAGHAPDQIALVYGTRRLTYRCLARRAAGLSLALAGKGLGPGAVVGICCACPVAAATAIIATCDAGAAWLPMEPGWPATRKAGALQTAQALIHDGDMEGLPPSLPAIHAGEAGEATPTQTSHPPGRLAYTIHTSGSTGVPKGVSVSHEALAFLFAAAGQRVGFVAGDRWALFHSAAFDFSIWEFWGALHSGGTLVVVPADSRTDPARFQALLWREAPQVIGLTPTALAGLLPDPGSRTLLSRSRAVRVAVAGGEMVPGPLASELLAQDVPLWNFYGPTEAAVWICASPSERGPDTLGEPLPGAGVLVLDEFGRPARAGGSGTLHLSGPGLAWGYAGAPRETADKFRPDAAGTALGRRIYDTGDCAAVLPDGGLRLAGRTDHQVKLSGYRVELGEVECVALRLPGVRQAAAMVCDGPDGGRQLCLALVAGHAGASGQVRAALARVLPTYMLPGRIVWLASLPMTSNNKLDRNALRRIAAHQPGEPASVRSSPASVLQGIVAGIWEGVLGRRDLGNDADFFALGGNSIRAAQVTARIRTALGRDVPVRRLFESPKLRDYADALGRAGTDVAAWSALDTLLPQKGAAPLSPAQRGVWVAAQASPSPAAFNIAIATRWLGPLRPAVLQQSLERVVGRHAILRSRIRLGRTAVCQESSGNSFAVDLLDLRGAADFAERTRAAVATLAGTPMDLSAGPLVRALLVRVTETEACLAVVLHHITCDAWSVVLLRREIAETYRDLCQGTVPAAPDAPIQYADYARWQATSGRAIWEPMLPWWNKQLAGGVPHLHLPSGPDVPGPLSGTLGAEPLARLASLAAGCQCTLFIVLLAAFKVALAKLSGQSDLWVGSAVSCRDHPRLESMVGLLVNTVVIRTRIDGCGRFADVVARVRASVLDAHEHRHVPYEAVATSVASDRGRGPGGVMHAIFELHDAPNEHVPLPEVRTELVDMAPDGAKFPLALLTQQVPSGLHYVLEHDPARYEAGQMRAVLTEFLAVLAMVADGDATVLSPAPTSGATDMIAPPRWRDRFHASAAPAVVDDVVERGFVSAEHGMPLVLAPGRPGADLAAWMAASRASLDEALARHGAVLFRGFCIDRAQRMQAVVGAALAEVMHENGEHIPVGDVKGVQTPVSYAKENKLLWHNENTFNRDWPTRILFACETPAETGGETPLVDTARLFTALPEAVRAPFVEHGVMYVRTYGRPPALPWQRVFSTQDASEVEAKCHSQGLRFAWLPDGGLLTRCIRPAVIRHQRTGELCWCNQAQHWHPACLDPISRRYYENLASKEDFPRDCRYGNGEPISDAAMRTIVDAFAANEVSFPWQAGDLLVVDNLKVAHGRNPYTGERRILVGMGDCVAV